MAFNIKKYQEISEFINNSSKTIGKTNCTIIAVSKTRTIGEIEGAIKNGIKHFGETKVQEANDKFIPIRSNYADLRLHMIGQIQTNKVKQSLNIFDYYHSLDRDRLAREFSKYTDKIQSKLFFVQVNTGKEPQKSGIEPQLTSDFLSYCKKDLKLNVIGLMCLPPINDRPKEHFLMLRDLAIKNNLCELSMGMSNDYKTGIECSASYIRIGTKFFGDRR